MSRAFNCFTPVRFGLLLALLIFTAFPQVLFGLQTFVIRDYGFFAYPLAHFQRECFWRGEIPFWDPYNYCGAPFLAQWNTMPLYPPALIYLLLPLTWSLGFFCLLHLWFGGLGMYFLARRWAQNDFAAAFAGTVFAFNGLTLNLLMWPSHVATFAWMPWVVLAVEKAWRDGGRKIFLAALAGGMQMLAGGPETIFLTWLFLLALWIQQSVVRRRQTDNNNSPARAALLWRFPIVVALVMALAAAQLLPFLDLAVHSERHGHFSDLRWSMPAWGWANFLVPMFFGTTANMGGVFFQQGQFWTSSYYLGIGAIWLALLAIGKKQDATASHSTARLLATATVIALVFALGENTFIYPAARRIFPPLNLITYPVKYVLLATFSVPLLAAFALARFETAEKLPRRILLVGGVLLALIGAILLWATVFPFPGDEVSVTVRNGISRAAFLILTGAVLFALAKKSSRQTARLTPLLLIVVAWADVWTHEPNQNPTAPPGIYQPNLAREKLAMNPQPQLGQSRAMISPSGFFQFVHSAIANPQNSFLVGRLAYGANANLLDDVPKVDGFFSLIPRECDDLQSLIYGNGATNADFPALENFLGVSQITAPDRIYRWQARTNFLPPITTGQKPVFLNDAETLRALAQPDFNPQKIVFLPQEEKSLVASSLWPENQSKRSPNPTTVTTEILASKFETQSVSAEIFATEPSLAVIAQTYWHDWRASVDGQPAPLLRANDAFQAVQIPAGKHELRLVYNDQAFQIGAAVSICGWAICLAVILFKRKVANSRK